MTTQLAIGYLAAGTRKPLCAGVPAQSAHVTEHDSITSRPAIPQAVISWSSVELQPAPMPLPVGAGDPAADIAGPLSFHAIGSSRAHGWVRNGLDGVLLGVLGVVLMALAVAVAYQLERPDATWMSRDDNPPRMALKGRVPVVEIRGLASDPVIVSESVAKTAIAR